MARDVTRVQLVGLLPAILKPCGPSCAQPFMNRSVAALIQEEIDETPASVRENAERAHALAEHLFRDFGHRVRIEVVGLDTPRGLWVGFRHRIGKGFAVVVEGKGVFRNPADYESVRAAVQDSLRRASPP